MRIEDQIKPAVDEFTERVPHRSDLADAVLRKARHRRHAARASLAGGSALAVAATAGLVFAAPWDSPAAGQGGTLAPAGGPTAAPTEQKDDEPTDVPSLDPRCVAPDETTLEEMLDCTDEPPPDTEEPKPPKLDPLPPRASQVAALLVNHDLWYLADSETGELTLSDWAWVTASPDGERLAVLENDHASRIGILDRASGEIEHWIDTPKGVGHAYWSPKGDQLVGTVYDKRSDPWDPEPAVRTGFFLADADASTSGDLVELAFQGGNGDDRWGGAVFWNGDGTGLLSSYTKDQGDTYGIRLLSLDGDVEKSLPNTGPLTPGNGVATSPDNRYAMTEPDKTKNHVIDLETGKVVENTRSFGAEAWLDNDRFIGDLAWDKVISELAIIEPDGTVVDRLWKAPREQVGVSGLAVSLDE